ncbi:MAG TPA: VTT domain-containing protein, partial [Bradyrhizobium sp.]
DNREKSLQPIDPGSRIAGLASVVQPVADPKEPLDLERTANRMWTPRTILAACGLAAALGGLALVWRYTSLSDFTDIGLVSSVISRSDVAPLVAIAAFVIGGLLMFPVVVLIAATAAALGPWLGFVTAGTGVLLSALVLFGIGRVLGQARLQRLLGRRALRVQSRIIGKGIVAVAMIRMVPIAPFSIVNVVAGASKLRLRDYMLGTALGSMPGIIAMAALGAQIADLARNASWANVLLLGLAIIAWIAVCLGAQFLVTWLVGRRT